MALLLVFSCFTISSALSETRSLSLYNIHTKEKISTTFKRDGVYDRAGLRKLSWMLRDWRTSEVVDIDPRLFDAMWEIKKETASSSPIHIVSGYRSNKTNDMLRSKSSQVAKNSHHTRGQAVDFFIPGVNLEKLRIISIKQEHGGVGVYYDSHFIHVDVGRVRTWPTRLTRKQLLALFPDGKTAHLPSDGPALSSRDAVRNRKTSASKDKRYKRVSRAGLGGTSKISTKLIANLVPPTKNASDAPAQKTGPSSPQEKRIAKRIALTSNTPAQKAGPSSLQEKRISLTSNTPAQKTGPSSPQEKRIALTSNTHAQKAGASSLQEKRISLTSNTPAQKTGASSQQEKRIALTSNAPAHQTGPSSLQEKRISLTSNTPAHKAGASSPQEKRISLTSNTPAHKAGPSSLQPKRIETQVISAKFSDEFLTKLQIETKSVDGSDISGASAKMSDLTLVGNTSNLPTGRRYEIKHEEQTKLAGFDRLRKLLLPLKGFLQENLLRSNYPQRVIDDLSTVVALEPTPIAYLPHLVTFSGEAAVADIVFESPHLDVRAFDISSIKAPL